MRHESNAAADVNAVHTNDPLGVQYAVVVSSAGAAVFGTARPPAVYPVPEPFVTSPDELYAVVAAPIELFVTNSAA
jgi:hypothetical protein